MIKVFFETWLTTGQLGDAMIFWCNYIDSYIWWSFWSTEVLDEMHALDCILESAYRSLHNTLMLWNKKALKQ